MKPTFILISFFLVHFLSAQTDTLRLSLPEIVALAQSDAPDALVAETRMKTSYWDYRSSLANFKPTLAFSGELPDLNRYITLIPLPDGSSAFIKQSQMRNRVGLSILQAVAPTGGTVYASTGLQRLDIFQPKAPDEVSYFSTPVSIGFDQPIFGFNTLKWEKKIAPLYYQEATREFAQNMEQVAFQAAEYYFQVLIAQLDLKAAKRDKENADTLYGISKGRFEVGRIAETELLQIELSAMNANAAEQLALLELQTGMEQLRNFLGIKQEVFFLLEEPDEIPAFLVEAASALSFATENRSETLAFQRRLVEADAEVANAKAGSGLRMNLNGEFSLSQRGDDLTQAYRDPEDNQRLSFSLFIPIVDWGKAKANLETAESRRDLERMIIGQEEVNFKQEILLKVKQLDLVRNQAGLALRAYEVSQKREEMTRNRYYIGKIDVTDLGIAVSEKEGARSNYMNALQTFWLAYYDLRRVTLFDFERNVSLVKRVEGY